MTHSEMAWEFAGLFHDLKIEEINEVLAKNVPIGMLEFFDSYGADVASAEGLDGDTAKRIPNMLLLGYLLRVLEERLLPEEPSDLPS